MFILLCWLIFSMFLLDFKPQSGAGKHNSLLKVSRLTVTINFD